MFRYKNEGNTISVELNNGYKIIATSRRNGEDTYTVRLSITASDPNIQYVNELDEFEIKSEWENLKTTIAAHITDKYYDGYFNRYIKDYEYMLKCFDRGNSLFETERRDV